MIRILRTKTYVDLVMDREELHHLRKKNLLTIASKDKKIQRLKDEMDTLLKRSDLTLPVSITEYEAHVSAETNLIIDQIKLSVTRNKVEKYTDRVEYYKSLKKSFKTAVRRKIDIEFDKIIGRIPRD